MQQGCASTTGRHENNREACVQWEDRCVYNGEIDVCTIEGHEYNREVCTARRCVYNREA